MKLIKTAISLITIKFILLLPAKFSSKLNWPILLAVLARPVLKHCGAKQCIQPQAMKIADRIRFPKKHQRSRGESLTRDQCRYKQRSNPVHHVLDE